MERSSGSIAFDMYRIGRRAGALRAVVPDRRGWAAPSAPERLPWVVARDEPSVRCGCAAWPVIPEKPCVCSGRALVRGLPGSGAAGAPMACTPRWSCRRCRAIPAAQRGFDLAAQRRGRRTRIFAGFGVLPGFLHRDGIVSSGCAQIARSRFDAAQSGKTKQHFGAKVNFKRQRLSGAGLRGLPAYVARRRGPYRWARSACAAAPNERTRIRLRRAGLSAFETTDAFVLRYAGDGSARTSTSIGR